MSDRPLRILIVAANAVRAAVLEDGLREPGSGADVPPLRADVTHVRDAADLVSSVRGAAADAVLMDLGSPSRETLERTLHAARRAQCPIAVFVDRSESGMAQAAVDAGVSAYVVDGLRKERVRPILDVAISRFRALDRLQTELAQARSALEDRKIIDQAKAILMRQRGLSEEETYALLRRTAMNQNRKIVDLARSVVAAAALLETPERGA